jgi:hypothetical protein
MRLIKLISFIFFLCAMEGSFQIAAAGQHDLYTGILQDYVDQGKVKYPPLCKDPRLEEYIGQLKTKDPNQLANEKERLAFWINAYNAYTLKVICDYYPVKSINDLHTGGLILGTVLNKTIWDKDLAVVNHKKFTLNHIEHKIIRPEFKDPRAHFALVCASKSCPALDREAYEGSKLDQQLNQAGHNFLSDPKRNRFDIGRKRAYLSKIFNWYGEDFGKNSGELLTYLSQFLSRETAAAIRSDVGNWKIDYLEYDWSLNE